MRKSHLKVALAGAVLAGVTAVSSGAHANLVQNGNFGADTVGPPLFYVSPPTDWQVTGSAGVDSQFPNGSDTNDAFIGTGTLSQTIATVPNENYTISFYAGVNDPSLGSDPDATLDAAFGGTDIIGGPISATTLYTPPTTSYTEFTDTVMATGTSTTLTFTGIIDVDNTGDGNYYVADVDVEAVAAPEPSAMLVLASALGLFTLMRIRRA
jgi:hypothetical protein